MKFTQAVLIMFFLSFPALAQENCQYGVSKCGKQEVCSKLDPNGTALCVPLPDFLPEIDFPLEAKEGAYCDQGALSPDGESHTYVNTTFALDLTSNRWFGASRIKASSSGTAIVFNQCKTENDNCGGGFGNYVQILREDGFMLMYAHLKDVYVKTGDKVRVKQVLGLEGTTGMAGENNRHLHFSVHYDWRINGFDYYRTKVGYMPFSVPFKMNICQPKKLNCLSKYIDIRQLKCTRITGEYDWLKIL